LADELFPTLLRFYKELESILSVNFLHPKPIFRPFINDEERALWEAKVSDDGYKVFCLDSREAYKKWHGFDHDGGFFIQQAGYVDVPLFLAATRTYLQAKGCYIEADFDYSKLDLSRGYVEYQGLQPTKIIFCEGAQATQNPFFSYLPFLLVKGELLTIKPAKPLDIIYNRSVFILPKSKDQALVGATYNWDDLTLTPTKEARHVLEAKMHKLLRIPYQILSQQAGIRPATFDRRPLIGLHPEYPQLGIFNGLGSKGVSLAPYLAAEFVQYLLYSKELPVEVRLDRIR